MPDQRHIEVVPPGSSGLARVQSALRDRNLVGALFQDPANVTYVTSLSGGLASRQARLHATMLVWVPADSRIEPTIVTTNLEDEWVRQSSGIADIRTVSSWVETRDLDIITKAGTSTIISRPVQWDSMALRNILSDLMVERGAPREQIGSDLEHVPASVEDLIRSCAPDATWVDVTRTIYALRSVKNKYELDCMREGIGLAEAGMQTVLNSVTEGHTVSDIRLMFAAGVADAALVSRTQGFEESWLVASVTHPDRPTTIAQPVTKGSVIKLDCGVIVRGYNCDGGRTAVFGHAFDATATVYTTLRDARRTAIDSMRPGTSLGDIFRTAEEYARGHGLPGYSRGHLGHSVGIDRFPEEPPFIAPDESAQLTPGMVMAFETPIASRGCGSMQLEDCMLVTDTGVETLHSRPDSLIVI